MQDNARPDNTKAKNNRKKKLIYRFVDRPVLFGIVFVILYLLSRDLMVRLLSFWTVQTPMQEGLFNICCSVPNIVVMALLAKYLFRRSSAAEPETAPAIEPEIPYGEETLPPPGTRFTLGFTTRRIGRTLFLSLPLILSKAVLLPLLAGLIVSGNATITWTIIIPTFLVSLMPGISEEMLTRSVVMGNMVRRYGADTKGIFLSAWLSSIIFGAIHFVNFLGGISLTYVLMQMAFSVGVGFTFAAMYLRTRNIIGCIIAHTIFDWLSFVISSAQAGRFLSAGETLGSVSAVNTASVVMMLIYTAIFIAVGMIMLRKSKRADIKKLWES